MVHVIATEYNRILAKIVEQGIDTGDTLALINETVTFDLRPLNGNNSDSQCNEYKLGMPFNRGQLETNINYGIAEGIWYRKFTRDIDLIKPFGKIWESMADDDGKVNSNYGYQLKNNNDLTALVYKLINSKHNTATAFIINDDNQRLQHDTVCNNAIELTLVETEYGYELSAEIIARSIDVIFGLPYDLFAAQGFLHMLSEVIACECSNAEDMPTVVKIGHINFHVANIHWYHKDNPTNESIDKLSNNIVTINAINTPFSLMHTDLPETVEGIKQFRNESANNSTVESIEIIDTSDDKSTQKLVELCSGDLQQVMSRLDKFIQHVTVTNESKAKAFVRANEIEVAINNASNKFDRKHVLFISNGNAESQLTDNIAYIAYVVYDSSQYKLLVTSLA